MDTRVKVIGGGLAGCEAAWQLARRGIAVDLHEMRPERGTEAHQTDKLAELVCSNSFRSAEHTAAVGLLKDEMRQLGSLILQLADEHRVPAGGSLAVDREGFSAGVTAVIESCPEIRLVRGEVEALPQGLTILASGPLTSQSMADSLAILFGEKQLYFYDAIAPIVVADSIDFSKAWRASRYDKGGDDYVNCPLNETEYETLIDDVLAADKIEARDFERCVHF
ncbi:MAG: methylenetetrahydrofolate--tRNA-(uracil(54)-C(5))-methyltransferase (FADH(2)-oxidizing) TrmFO, partial [bacterium]